MSHLHIIVVSKYVQFIMNIYEHELTFSWIKRLLEIFSKVSAYSYLHSI